MTNVYRFFFHWNKPKNIFMVCSYGKEPIVMAAKRLRIPVVELQHGVVTNYHLGYSVAPGQHKLSFPDYFLTFGDYWVNSVNYSIDDNNIIPIGYPYFTREIQNYRGVEKKNQIIFISQGTIGKKLSELAIKFAHEVNSSVEVVYKLHPGEYDRWKIEYKGLFESQEHGVLSVIDGEYPSLYQLLAESTWQVGVNSTVLFEGLGLKCRTIIVELPGHEHMDQLILENKALLIKPDTPIPYLQAPVVDHSMEQIFRTNWQEALNNFLKELAR
jgi:hypothetical protein